MGLLDRYERARWYRNLWDRDWCGHRPWTHTARRWCRRHQLLCACLWLAAGACCRGGPWWIGGAILILSIILGHLWV